MAENTSEIARLRNQIEAEYVAAQRGLQEYAIVTRHEFITTRMENMERYHRQLVEIVGEAEATDMVAQVFGMEPEGKRG
ncbi:MAG: hypothetical protein H0U76_13040 [Ktedonobacteraceae bacterium]|nr:hypothetical protein [Ktedonobacteraceae bacterium]